MLLRFQGKLYRASKIVTAAQVYVYHGTATGTNDVLLNRIMKEGLNPFPKRRVFNEQRGEGQHAREISSYGGVYFNHDPYTATTYMFDSKKQNGGDGLLVIARIETRSPGTAGDEDRFGLPGGVYSNLLGEYYAADLGDWVGNGDHFDALKDSAFDWETPARYVLQHSRSLKNHPDDPRQIAALTPVMADFIHWNTFYGLVREDQRGQLWGNDKYKLRELAIALDLTYEEIYRRFRQAHDLLLRKMKQLVVQPKGDAWWSERHTFRYLEPVGFRGVNRIVALLRIDEPQTYENTPPYDYVVTVVYKVPEADHQIKNTLDVLKARQGEHMLWTDLDGTVLYDKSKQQKKAAGVEK